jgi:hypothetical protein
VHVARIIETANINFWTELKGQSSQRRYKGTLILQLFNKYLFCRREVEWTG